MQQIAVFKAWQKYQTWEPAKNDKFQGYAYMAVAGQVKMSVRRQNWFEHSDLVGETHFENGLDSLMRSPDDPETQVQLAELATKVEALPERERLVIQQYFSDGVETDMLRNAIARLREIYQQPLRGLTIQFGLFDEYA